LRILGNIPIVEIRYAQVKNNRKKKGKIKDDKIEAIITFPNYILDIPVNSENKNGLDKKIK
jgi:hypothetical protein